MMVGGIYICRLENAPLEVQEASCLERASTMGYDIAADHVWRDDVANVDGVRPAFQQMLRAVARREIAELFVYLPANVHTDDTVRAMFVRFCQAAHLRPNYVARHLMDGGYDEMPELLATLIGAMDSEYRSDRT